MTKAEIVEAVYQQINLSKKESAELVDSVFEMIRSQLEKGESVKIPRFGNFTIRSKVPRRGRNPKTGEEIEITARKVLTFKPSQILRDRVNNR
ncbi:MAG: integration host factor subunit alpha [Magnetococcales bacterium]|nr:integration host factor subunit alpha [Magnetococcales bacterium]